MIKNWCKDNANERNESLLSNCRVQLIFCKDTHISLKSLYLVFGRHYRYSVSIKTCCLVFMQSCDIRLVSCLSAP